MALRLPGLERTLCPGGGPEVSEGCIHCLAVKGVTPGWGLLGGALVGTAQTAQSAGLRQGSDLGLGQVRCCQLSTLNVPVLLGGM